MAKVDVLIEVLSQQPEAFARFHAAMDSEIESMRQGEALVANLAGMGLEVLGEYAPVPMFAETTVFDAVTGFAAFAAPMTNPDLPSRPFRKYVPSYFGLLRRRNRRSCADLSPPSGPIDL